LAEVTEGYIESMSKLYTEDQYLGFIKYLNECDEDATEEMKKLDGELKEYNQINDTNA
jgi:hypothetical protein